MTLQADHDEVFSRLVAPYFPELPYPYVDYRPGWPQYEYQWDPTGWRPTIIVPTEASDEVWVHENGHHLEDHCGRWRAGGSHAALVEFLAWHGADPLLISHVSIREFFADHFKCAYAGGLPSNPVPWQSVEYSQQFFQGLREGAWAMAKFVSEDIGIQLDAQGNTDPNGVVVFVTGLRPGYPAVGVVQRIGLSGAESAIGDATFQTDTPTQSYGRIHVRGASPAEGTAYYRVAAFQ